MNTGHGVVHVTTVYDGPHTPASLSKRFLSGEKLSHAKGRRCAALKNDQAVQRYNILHAFDRIDPAFFKLAFIGSCADFERVYQLRLCQYAILELVLMDRIRIINLQSGVLVFSSMCERVLLVCLVAFVFGLPIIVSMAIGSSGCVANDVNGFVIESFSEVNYLEKFIRWCIEHPAEVVKLRV